MDIELKELADEVKKSIAEFQAANDAAMAEKMDKGQVDVLLQENVDKANTAIDAANDKMQERIDEIERKANYSALNRSGTDPNTEAAEAAELARLVTGDPNASMDVEAYREYQVAFAAYVRRGPAISGDMKAALEVGGDPTGGYYVTPDLSGRISRLVFETSEVRRHANVQTIGTDSLEGFNDLNEADSGWVGEKQARPDTATPETGKWIIPVHEIYAQPKATQKMLDDTGFNVEGWLQGKVSNRFSRQEENAFVLGDGVLKPRGFLTYDHGIPTAAAWAVIERIPSGAAGAFKTPSASPVVSPADPLIDMVAALKAPYRANSRWMMGRTTWAAARKLTDNQGRYLFGSHALAEGVLEFRLLGFPVSEAEDMPAIAANSLSIAFGDFREAYQIVDRTGIRILRDPFTDKPNIRFYTTKRVGGNVVNFEAIKLMRFATTAG